jgi:putative membrane protein
MFKRRMFTTALGVSIIVSPTGAFQPSQTPPPTTRPIPDVPPQDKNSTPKANDATADAKFMMTAYEDGEAEIALADLAVTKSESADVKAFANKIKTDHKQADGELQELAGKKNMTLAETPSPTAQTDERKTTDRLQKLSGADFDRAYANTMVGDHRKAVTEFEKASKSTDPDVREFADKTLPVLKDHLQRAENLQKKAGK